MIGQLGLIGSIGRRRRKAQQSIGPAPWVPAGALMALEFDNQRYWLDGLGTVGASALRFSRASQAYHLSGGHRLGIPVLREVDQPSIAPDGILLRDAAAQQLMVDVGVANWTSSGTPTFVLTGDMWGTFPGYAIGSTSAGHRKYKTIPGGWEAGVARDWLVVYKSGTANQLRVTMRNEVAGNVSTLQGASGAIVSTATTAGTFSLIEEYVLDALNGIRMVTFRFTPAATSNNANIGYGSASTTGGTVVIFATNRWNADKQEFAPVAMSRMVEQIAPPLATGTYDLLVLNSGGLFEWRDDYVQESEIPFDFSDSFNFANPFAFYTPLLPAAGKDRILATYAFPAGLSSGQKTAYQGALVR